METDARAEKNEIVQFLFYLKAIRSKRSDQLFRKIHLSENVSLLKLFLFNAFIDVLLSVRLDSKNLTINKKF